MEPGEKNTGVGVLGRAVAFVVCGIALLLPGKLRVLYADAVGWVVQLFYGVYFGMLNFILRELRKSPKGKDRVARP